MNKKEYKFAGPPKELTKTGKGLYIGTRGIGKSSLKRAESDVKKEIPMLFSTDMVKALINDLKTETRRDRNLKEINENPDEWTRSGFLTDKRGLHVVFEKWYEDRQFDLKQIKCPYGNVGDFIYCRETFHDGYNSVLDGNIGKEEKDWTQQYWVFKDGGHKYSTGEMFPGKENPNFLKGVKWRPGIHMPKPAARIWLEITEIKVERLQDISFSSAIREGIERDFDDSGKGWFTNYLTPHISTKDPIKSYKSLWEKINGKGSWDKNPWIWVVKFQKVQK